jgi:hypothetical protein
MRRLAGFGVGVPLLTILTPLIEWIPGADHSNTFRPQGKQAMSCLAAGRTAKAIRLYKRTVADCERMLGADHPKTKAARKDLAALTGEP